jgi:hypothetical protein
MLTRLFGAYAYTSQLLFYFSDGSSLINSLPGQWLRTSEPASSSSTLS